MLSWLGNIRFSPHRFVSFCYSCPQTILTQIDETADISEFVKHPTRHNFGMLGVLCPLRPLPLSNTRADAPPRRVPGWLVRRPHRAAGASPQEPQARVSDLDGPDCAGPRGVLDLDESALTTGRTSATGPQTKVHGNIRVPWSVRIKPKCDYVRCTFDYSSLALAGVQTCCLRRDHVIF